MASIASTSGQQEGQLPAALAWPLITREEASLPRFFPLVEAMLAIALLSPHLLINIHSIGLLPSEMAL